LLGLPLIDVFIKVDFRALGFEADPFNAHAQNFGQSYIAHIGAQTAGSWLEKRQFAATIEKQPLS
jgi:hypothetical protein